jgi:hypothetical protein
VSVAAATMTDRTDIARRRGTGLPAFRLLVAVVGTATLCLSLAAPASAKQPCWRDVVADWYDNGRVDKVYALACYQEAIDNLPEDVETYSSAKDDISRALQQAVRGNRSGGGSGGATPEVRPSVPRSKSQPSAGRPTVRADTPKASSGVLTSAVERLGAGDADSIPIPLLVLAGLAFLFLAAGTSGFIARRVQARRVAINATPVAPRPERQPGS